MRRRLLVRRGTRYRVFLRRFMLLALSVCLLLCSSGAPLVLGGSVALAHSFVIGSDPVDGSTVATVPRVVRIFFEAPISSASIAYVYTPDEQMVDATHSIISGKDARELDTPLITPNQLPQGSYTVRWTALASIDGHTTHGVIGFNVGRSSSGLTGETILGPSTSNMLPELDAIGVLAVAWEWLVLMALTFWVGILVVEGFILAGDEHSANLLVETHKRARPLQWLCLAALFVGELITLLLRATQLSQSLQGSGIDLTALEHILFETAYGSLWLLRIAFIVAALGLLWWTTRAQRARDVTESANRTRIGGRRFRHMRQQAQQIQQNQQMQQVQRITQELSSGSVKGETVAEEGTATKRGAMTVWLLLAGLILLTLALSGDVTALAQAPISAVILEWLYLVARCIWLGAIAYLGYVLLPLLAGVESEQRSEILTFVVRRFRLVLLATLGVFLVCGLFLTETTVSSIQQFITAAYGRTLLVEWLLVVAMILLSAFAIFTLQPKLSRQALLLPVVDVELPAKRARQSALDQTTRNLKYVFRVQSWLGMGVLLCAALLSFFAPPIVFPSVDYTQHTLSSTVGPTALNVQTQETGDLAITLQVLPGRIHYANTVVVALKDRASGDLITDAVVQMRINMVVMDMGTSSANIRGDNPTYIATFKRDSAFTMAGDWDIGLTIVRQGRAPVQAYFMVTIG